MKFYVVTTNGAGISSAEGNTFGPFSLDEARTLTLNIMDDYDGDGIAARAQVVQWEGECANPEDGHPDHPCSPSMCGRRPGA